MNIQISDLFEIAIGLLPSSIIPVLLISLVLGWLLKRLNVNIYWRALIYSIIGTSLSIISFDPRTYGQGGKYNPINIEDTLKVMSESPMPALAVLILVLFIFSYVIFISAMKPTKAIFKILAVVITVAMIVVVSISLHSIT